MGAVGHSVRDVALAIGFLAVVGGVVAALVGAALGRLLPVRWIGWAILAAVVGTAAAAVVVVGTSSPAADDSDMEPAIDLLRLLSLGLQPLGFSFGIWIGHILRSTTGVATPQDSG